MTRKDQLINYIDSFSEGDILVTKEYHLLNGYKIDEKRSVHAFNCDAVFTKEIIENNFNTELVGSYIYDAEGNPIDGVVVLIDSWEKGIREYPAEDIQEGGND